MLSKIPIFNIHINALNLLKSHQIILSILTGLVFACGLMVSNSFTDPLMTPKQFYFYFSVLLIMVWICIQCIRKKQTLKLSFSLSDVFVLAYLFYCILSITFTSYVFFTDNDFVTLVLLGVLYFISKHIGHIVQKSYSNSKQLVIINTFILSVALIQVVIGFLQLSGKTVYNEDFRITGRFNNSGPYAIFLSMVLSYALGLILYGCKQKFLKYYAIIVVVIIIVMLPLTQSRTSWIAASGGIIFIISHKFNWLNKLSLFLNTQFKKLIAISISLLVLLSLGYMLYNYKKDSALGRTFIWKITLNMIKDRPLTGFGFSQYENAHNNYQVTYFKNNPENIKEKMLAGDSPYAFNDYFQTATELGIIGLLLFIGIFTSAFFIKPKHNRYDKNKNFYLEIAKGVLIVFFISAFFSYPIRKIPLASFIFFITGLAASYQKNILSIKLKRNIALLFSMIILFSSLMLIRYEYLQMNAYKEWKNAYITLHSGNKDKALRIYESVYKRLRHDQLFMFNYGAELSVLKQYEESILILQETLHLLNNVDVYKYLGISYYGNHKYSKAVSAFTKASHMIPHLFYPKYCLTLLYLETGNKQEALKLAREILNMPVKIKSALIDRIKYEMQKLVNNN